MLSQYACGPFHSNKANFSGRPVIHKKVTVAYESVCKQNFDCTTAAAAAAAATTADATSTTYYCYYEIKNDINLSTLIFYALKAAQEATTLEEVEQIPPLTAMTEQPVGEVVYWNLYFCTGTCISVLGHIFLFRNIYFLYWNIHISILEYSYFCTGIHVFVLEYTFLYWNTYFCTGT